MWGFVLFNYQAFHRVPVVIGTLRFGMTELYRADALSSAVLRHEQARRRGEMMGRYALLWLLGVPIPILLLIWAFGGLH
jgi:hypothetical protein